MRNLLLCFILTLFLFNCSDNVGKKKTETTTAVDTVMNVTADSMMFQLKLLMNLLLKTVLMWNFIFNGQNCIYIMSR